MRTKSGKKTRTYYEGRYECMACFKKGRITRPWTIDSECVHCGSVFILPVEDSGLHIVHPESGKKDS